MSLQYTGIILFVYIRLPCVRYQGMSVKPLYEYNFSNIDSPIGVSVLFENDIKQSANTVCLLQTEMRTAGDVIPNPLRSKSDS